MPNDTALRARHTHDNVRAVLALALTMLVASPSPSSTDETPRLLVLDLTAGKGIEKDTATTFTEFLTAYLSETTKLVVVSKRDIARLADLEADKQQQGCDGSDACMAEIGGALGAHYVVFGRMSKLGETSFVHLTLVDTTSGQPLARRVVNAATLEQLAIEMKRATIDLATSIGARKPNTTFGAPSSTSSSKPLTPVTPRVARDPEPSEQAHRVPENTFDDDTQSAPRITTTSVENRKEFVTKLRDDSASKIALGAGVIGGGLVVGAGATAITTALFINNPSATGIPLGVCVGCVLLNIATAGYGSTVLGDGLDLSNQADRVENGGKRVAMSMAY